MKDTKNSTKQAVEYQRQLLSSFREDYHQGVVDRINQESFETLNTFTWVCWAITFVGALLFGLFRWQPSTTTTSATEMVFHPSLWLLLVLPLCALRLHPALQKKGAMIWILNFASPVIIPAYYWWWRGSYECYMRKELVVKKECADLMKLDVRQNNPQENLIVLKKLYAERKYGQLKLDIEDRIDKTCTCLAALEDETSPFYNSTFVVNLRATLQEQHAALRTHHTEVSKKRVAIVEELEKCRKQLKELEKFRDIIESAELVKDNEEFLKEYQYKVRAIEENSERLVLNTNKDVLDTRTLIQSLPEVQHLYSEA